MKAWEIHHGQLDLRDVRPPVPRPWDTLIRVSHAGICGSDLPKLLRSSDFGLPDPWRPGHEIVGIDPDDRDVAVDPLIPCGNCVRCVNGDTNLCPCLRRLGWDLPGGFAERIAVPIANTYPVPDGVDPLDAVVADPAAVAIHGLRCDPVSPPGRLVVIGMGTIGLLTSLEAHQRGWDVTLVHREGRVPHQSLAEAVPATIDSPTGAATRDLFDVAVDAASGADPTPLEMAVRLVRDGGTIIVQNAYHPDVHLPTPLRELFGRSIRLIGSFSHCRREPGDFALALDFISRHGASTSIRHLIAEGGELADLGAVIDSPPPRGVRYALSVGSP